MSGKNGVEFSRKVGIVAGALLAVGTLLHIAASFAWVNATRPILSALAEERRARVEGDSLILGKLIEMSHDRVDLMEAMNLPAGPERTRAFARIRHEWRER